MGGVLFSSRDYAHSSAQLIDDMSQRCPSAKDDHSRKLVCFGGGPARRTASSSVEVFK